MAHKVYADTMLNKLTDDSISELSTKFDERYNYLRNQLKPLVVERSELEHIDLTDENRLLEPSEYEQERAYNHEHTVAYTKEMRQINDYRRLLEEYGNSFVNLYNIKENQEHFAYYDSETTIRMVEVSRDDFDDETPRLTNEQYVKSCASYPENSIKEVALEVTLEDGFAFNIGVTDFNVPNEDKPQSKALVMIDSENTELDNAKLKKIFEFCEAHGIPTDSMEIRHFDGTLAEAEIQTKMAQVLEKFREEKATALAEYNKKLAEEQTIGRAQSLEDLQTLVNEKGEGILAELGFSAQDYVLKDGKLQLLASGQAKFQDMVSGENPDNDIIVPADKVPTAQNDNLSDGSTDNTVKASYSATAAIPKSDTAPTKATTASAVSNTSKLERKKVEKEFEKFFEEGLAKTRKLSYFKTKTSLVGGWTEYIIYDKEDKDNRKLDEKGLPKPYNFKFFIKKDSDGNFHFAYRTPNRKKLDDATMGGIAGTLKGLGFTHVNFPKGLPDCDKGAWRKALAEQGIVPVGISIDRSKAEGMLKAAKDKLSSEEYAKYKYRLGLQLQENAIKKGKKLPDSEQQFIEGLLNSHKYEPFTDAYSNILKGKMTRILREKDEEFGAIKKIAAYRTLSSLFNAYNEAVKTNSNIPGINIRAENMNIQQIEQLYDVFYAKQQKLVKTELYKELIDVRYKSSIGAKRADKIIINDLYKEARNKCNEINEDLSAMGVDEIGLIKSYDASLGYSDFLDRYLPEYKEAHPELKQTANASGKTQQPAVRKTVRDIN